MRARLVSISILKIFTNLSHHQPRGKSLKSIQSFGDDRLVTKSFLVFENESLVVGTFSSN